MTSKRTQRVDSKRTGVEELTPADLVTCRGGSVAASQLDASITYDRLVITDLVGYVVDTGIMPKRAG